MESLSWADLLRYEDPEGDRRWARLVPGPKADVEEEVRELAEQPPPGGAYVMVVRGERCRDSQSLFREWDREWQDFFRSPRYSGRNWDGFGESLEELASREQADEDPAWGAAQPDAVLVLVLRSIELLQDESSRLRTLTEVMRDAAFGLAWEDKDRPRMAEMRIVFQCEPGEVETLRARLAQAGLDLQEEPLKGQSEGASS